MKTVKEIKMQATAIFTNGEPELSASGKAIRIWLCRVTEKIGVWLPVSQTSFDKASGQLDVAPWLHAKALARFVKIGYSIKGATWIKNAPAEIVAEVEHIKAEELESAIKKGFFTVVRQDGDHRTFRIKTSPRTGKTVIGLLTGSNNTSDYVYFAFVQGTDLKFFFKNTFDKPKMVEYFKTICGNPNEAGHRYAVESNHCCRCNAVLTVPESVKSGFGPECVKMGFGASK